MSTKYENYGALFGSAKEIARNRIKDYCREDHVWTSYDDRVFDRIWSRIENDLDMFKGVELGEGDGAWHFYFDLTDHIIDFYYNDRGLWEDGYVILERRTRDGISICYPFKVDVK